MNGTLGTPMFMIHYDLSVRVPVAIAKGVSRTEGVVASRYIFAKGRQKHSK